MRGMTKQQRPSGTVEGECLNRASFTALSGYVQAHFFMLDITSLLLNNLQAELHRHGWVFFAYNTLYCSHLRMEHVLLIIPSQE